MHEKTKKIFLWALDLLVNAVIIFGLVIIIQKWIVAPFDVSGASMCNTLNFINGSCTNDYGEKIIINEATYLFNEPERGDIVVFKPNELEDKYFIKRVIGLPGETVEIKDGKVYVTNREGKETIVLQEDYLNNINKDNTKVYFSDFSVFEVPENRYFMLGDNRQASTDSRSCFEGTIDESCKNNVEKAFVPREAIRGKAWVVWWPIKNARKLEHPIYPNISESLEEK